MAKAAKTVSPPKKRALEKVSRDLGISRGTLYKRMREDADFEKLVRGGAPIAELVDFWAKRGQEEDAAIGVDFDPVALSRRKTIALTERAEAEAAIKKMEADTTARELLGVDEVVAEYTRALGSAKNRIMGVPSIFRNHLAGYHTDGRECAELETILGDLLRDALELLAADLEPNKKKRRKK